MHTANRRKTSAALLIATLVASLLSVFAGASPARAEPRWCGGGCDGKSPSAVVMLLDGRQVRCNASQRRVYGPAYPEDPGYFDPAEDNTTDYDFFMRASHFYSTECQTTWLQVTNDRAIGRTFCSMQETRTAAGRARTVTGACPAQGKTTTTPMLDDHDANGASINYGLLIDNGGGWPYRQVRTPLY